MTEPTLFTRIINHEIPANIVHQDARAIVFHDIAPQAPVHVLIVPVKPLPSINEAGAEDTELLGYLLTLAKQMAAQLQVAESGYRLIINNGRDANQEVPHLHIHLLAGRGLGRIVSSG